MTGGAGHQLRRLVDTAASLDEAVGRLGKRNSHELGLGITKRREYSTPTGKLKLPTFGPALDALADVVRQPVHDLDDEKSQAAWGLLLGAPGVVVPMPELTNQDIALQGLNVGAEDVGKLRQLVLVVVIRPSREWDDSNALTMERLGGVGFLTLALNDHGPGSRRAWLQAQWASTTREFVSILEPVYERAGYLNKPATTRVAVVIDKDFTGAVPSDLLTSLGATAAVCGLNVEGFVLEPSAHTNILNSLATEPHGHLITLGSGPGMEAVEAQFRAQPAGAITGRLSRVSGSAPLEGLRERFTKIAGVSAALQPLLEPTTGFFAMPITPTNCLHDGAFVYVQAGETGLWWTEDLDRHGGSVFKTYAMVNKQLRFEADRDSAGDVITKKWKGKKRFEMSLSSLAPCGHLTESVESHVRVPHPDAP